MYRYLYGWKSVLQLIKCFAELLKEGNAVKYIYQYKCVWDDHPHVLPNMYNLNSIHKLGTDVRLLSYILRLRKLKEERAKMTEEELIGLPPLPSIPNMKWNYILTVVHHNGGGTQIIDRRSWISMDDQPCRYRLDPNALPL